MKRKISLTGMLMAGLMFVILADGQAFERPVKENKLQMQNDTTKWRKNDKMKGVMPHENDSSMMHKNHRKKMHDSTDMNREYKKHDSIMKDEKMK